MPLYLSDPVLLCVCVVMSNSSGNTVPTCFWVFYYILRTPQLVEDLRKEVNKVCGVTDGKVDGLFTQVRDFTLHVVMSNQDITLYSYHQFSSYNPTSSSPYLCTIYQDQLNNLHLLDACVTETMRIASGTLLMRIVQRPCSITLNSGNTYHFRKGDRVGIAPPITHHDSEV